MRMRGLEEKPIPGPEGMDLCSNYNMYTCALDKLMSLPGAWFVTLGT